MDDLITYFVQVSTPEEAQEDIFQCLGLFQAFNYLEPYPALHDLLSQESFLDVGVTLDTFTGILLTSQQYLLDRHGISLVDSTTLNVNNDFLRVLLQLQKLEDPVPVLTILETMESHEYKFALIMELLASKPVEWSLRWLEDIRPVCLNLLGEYLYMQEDNQTVPRGEVPAIKNAVRTFKEVFGINQAVRVILDSNTVMGEEFNLYLPLYDELREVVEDEGTLVETLLFLIIYSSDGHIDPIGTYNKFADYLIGDLSTANRLGLTLAEMILKMQRHKEKQSHEEK